MDTNIVTITGNLTRDPELKYGQRGNAVARFGLAYNRRWFDKTKNDYTEEVSFFNVVAFAAVGENAVDTLRKGDRVVVTGRLQQRSWETDNGEKRSSVEIIADELAPSLRWATATVVRNEKRETVGGSRPAPPEFDGEEPF